MNKEKYCIIMAGGAGTRFWPVSRTATPKQFLDILGTGKTFLQSTVERFARIFPSENIFIVTSTNYKDLVKEQVPQIPTENILLESRKRNTAPCIAYATYKLLKKNPEASVIVAPSDHLILNEDLFLDTVTTAIDYAAEHDELFTIGIKPTRAETQYGYIQMNTKDVPIVINGSTAYKVKTFTEKPNAEMAKVLVESGEFLWNSGLFVWSLKTIKRELERYVPDIARAFQEISDYYYTPSEQEKVDEVYEGCLSISIDYGVMEKSDNIWVYEASFGWSDIGTWEALYRYNKKDPEGNVLLADKAVLSNTKECIVVSEEKGKLISLMGLKGYMVISTKDVLLVCPRGEKELKELLTDLSVNNLSEYQ